MSQIIDGRGSEITLYTRRGADLQFELDLDTTDLTGYSARVLINGLSVAMSSSISGSLVMITFDHGLTATSLTANRYSVSIVAPDGIVSPLVYGALYVSEWAA